MTQMDQAGHVISPTKEDFKGMDAVWEQNQIGNCTWHEQNASTLFEKWLHMLTLPFYH